MGENELPVRTVPVSVSNASEAATAIAISKRSGSVFVDEFVFRASSGVFQFASQGQLSAKGYDRPISVFAANPVALSTAVAFPTDTGVGTGTGFVLSRRPLPHEAF